MAKVLKCDSLFPGCEGIVRADTDEEVLRLAAEHVRQVHGLGQVDDAIAQKVLAAIATE